MTPSEDSADRNWAELVKKVEFLVQLKLSHPWGVTIIIIFSWNRRL